MPNLRYATIADVPAIGEIIQESFGEELNHQHGMEIIDRAKNLVWVVEEDHQILGFVSAYKTIVNHAIRRWEIDLLAVHPRARGQRLGLSLLKAVRQDARDSRANFSRGLVRLDNKAAQLSFKRADYMSTGQVYALYMWEPSDLGVTYPDDDSVTILRIETITYKGMWLEGLSASYLSDEMRYQYIAAARTQAARYNLQLVSALLPLKRKLSEEVAQGGTILGEYQWWRTP